LAPRSRVGKGVVKTGKRYRYVPNELFGEDFLDPKKPATVDDFIQAWVDAFMFGDIVLPVLHEAEDGSLWMRYYEEEDEDGRVFKCPEDDGFPDDPVWYVADVKWVKVLEPIED